MCSVFVEAASFKRWFNWLFFPTHEDQIVGATVLSFLLGVFSVTS